MRYVQWIVAPVIATIVGITPAAAQRYPRSYAPPFTPEWAAPQLVVIPEIGPPGTEVEIQIPRGKFHRGLQAFYGDQPMQILAVSKRSVIAVIPWGVRGADYIYVVDYTGRARTYVPFAIERPPSRYYRYR